MEDKENQPFKPRRLSWILHPNDPHYGLSIEEIQDRMEFIRCYLMAEFEALLSLHAPDPTEDFFIRDFRVADGDYSAFNTHDFHSKQPPFN